MEVDVKETDGGHAASLDDLDSLVENLIEYTSKYFRADDATGIACLVGDAEDILIAHEERDWDDIYLRKTCERKFHDWKREKTTSQN